MCADANTETNQTAKTISSPEQSEGIENQPEPNQKPDEHVPPVEIPGRPETPEHIPEKIAHKI